MTLPRVLVAAAGLGWAALPGGAGAAPVTSSPTQLVAPPGVAQPIIAPATPAAGLPPISLRLVAAPPGSMALGIVPTRPARLAPGAAGAAAGPAPSGNTPLAPAASSWQPGLAPATAPAATAPAATAPAATAPRQPDAANGILGIQAIAYRVGDVAAPGFSGHVGGPQAAAGPTDALPTSGDPALTGEAAPMVQGAPDPIAQPAAPTGALKLAGGRLAQPGPDGRYPVVIENGMSATTILDGHQAVVPINAFGSVDAAKARTLLPP